MKQSTAKSITIGALALAIVANVGLLLTVVLSNQTNSNNE